MEIRSEADRHKLTNGQLNTASASCLSWFISISTHQLLVNPGLPASKHCQWLRPIDVIGGSDCINIIFLGITVSFPSIYFYQNYHQSYPPCTKAVTLIITGLFLYTLFPSCFKLLKIVILKIKICYLYFILFVCLMSKLLSANYLFFCRRYC